MTGFAVAALLFALLFMGFLIAALTKSSGRDGSHAATRTTAHADNPPGSTSVPHPRGSGNTSAS